MDLDISNRADLTPVTKYDSLGMTHQYHVNVGARCQHLGSVGDVSTGAWTRKDRTYTSVKVRGMLNFREQCSTACFETSTIAVTLYICESKPRVGSYMLELVERDRYYTSDMYDLTCVHIAISPAPTTCV